MHHMVMSWFLGPGKTSNMFYQLNHLHWPNDQQGKHLPSSVCLCVQNDLAIDSDAFNN